MMHHSRAELPVGLVLRVQPGISSEVRSGRLQVLRSVAAVYTMEPNDAAVLGRWIPALDGSRSLAAVAEVARMPVDMVCASALDLYRAGLLAEAGISAVAVDPELFYDHARAAALIWGEAAGETTILDVQQRGSETARLVLGALVEQWQYARTAPARLTLAAQKARSAAARELWVQLAAEEMAWAKELEAGLELAPAAHELARACPLPGTAALCEQMRRAAGAGNVADQLGYAACVGVASAAEASSNGLLAYFGQLSALGTAPARVLESFLRYAEFTAERASHDPIRALFAEQRPLPFDTRRVVLGHLAEHVHAVNQFHRNVFDFHSGAARPNLAQGNASTGGRPVLGRVRELWTVLLNYRRG